MSGSVKRAIVIVGGFNSVWTGYLKMARDLEDVTGLPAIGVPLMPWHWWLAGRREDATNILGKIEETIVWARRRLGASRFILVGHSAGGVAGRLYLCDQQVWGRVYAGLEHVDALITLGSPHCSQKGTEFGWFLTDKANRLVPGTPYGQVRYLTVGGRFLQGHKNGSYEERRAFRLYAAFGGRGDIWGDGMIPLHCAGLDGVENLVLDGVAHSRKVDRVWYGGSAAVIRGWWPQDVHQQGVAHAE